MAQFTTTDLSDRLQSQLTGFEAGRTNQDAELEEYVNFFLLGWLEDLLVKPLYPKYLKLVT